MHKTLNKAVCKIFHKKEVRLSDVFSLLFLLAILAIILLFFGFIIYMIFELLTNFYEILHFCYELLLIIVPVIIAIVVIGSIESICGYIYKKSENIVIARCNLIDKNADKEEQSKN